MDNILIGMLLIVSFANIGMYIQLERERARGRVIREELERNKTNFEVPRGY